MTTIISLEDRALLTVSGEERFSFLNTLLSADVSPTQGQARFAALLSPQGKLLADLIVFTDQDRLWIDFPKSSDFAKRLRMYKLRAAVEMEVLENWSVGQSLQAQHPTDISFEDPRHPSLGWRLYSSSSLATTGRQSYDLARIQAVVPEGPEDLEPNKALLLESGFERLGGLDFTKGCYVGQEVTARMKYRNLGKKRLMSLKSSEPLTSGDAITANDRAAGTVLTAVGMNALALMRHEYLGTPLKVGTMDLEIVSDPDNPQG